MLIKPLDDEHALLAEIDALLEHPDVPADSKPRLRDERKRLSAGLANRRDAAQKLERLFGQHKHWALLHGLRLERDGGDAEIIDHLLLNRLGAAIMLGSRHYHARPAPGVEGGLVVHYGARRYELSHPFQALERALPALQRALDAQARAGEPPWHGHPRLLFAAEPDARLQECVAESHLQKEMDRAAERLNAGAPALSQQRLWDIATQLAHQHQPPPSLRARFGLPARLAPRNPREAALQALHQAVDKARRDAGEAPDDEQAACAVCGVALTPTVIAYCRKHAARFGHRLLCMKCQGR